MNYYDLLYALWALVFIIAIAIELHTQQLLGWAASIGSVGAIIAHLFTGGEPVWIEILVFIIIWVFAWLIFFLIFGRKIRVHDQDDGYLAFIGSEQIASIGNESIQKFGQLKINDKVFRFKATTKINKGDTIIVKRIRGITMYVEKKGEK